MNSKKILRPLVAVITLLTFVFALPGLAQEKSLYGV